MKKFNLTMVFVFILFAIINSQIMMNTIVSLVILLCLLLVLLLGNYLYKKNQEYSEKRKVNFNTPYLLFLYFLICGLVIMGIMAFLGENAPLEIQKILSCLLCLSAFFAMIAGYVFEKNYFKNSEVLLEPRCLGLAINPRHPIGRIIYIGVFIFIIAIFLLILILGPTH